MSRIISEFSVRDINSIENYERFFHTKNYLRSKTIPTDGDFKLSRAVMTESKDMMTALGFSNLEKFIRLKGDWDSLRRKIPLAYLDYIGADRKTLAFTLECDYEEYRATLEIPRYPKTAVVRLMAAVYNSVRIPEGFSEGQAMDYLFGIMEKRRVRCCINYPQLLSVFLEPGRKVNRVYYPPSLSFARKYATPCEGGEDIGVSRIC